MSPESGLSPLWYIFEFKSFPGWNSMLPDPQLQSAVDVPTFRPQMPLLADSEPKPASHGGLTEMTTVRFEQDHGVGTIVLANPPSNRIGSQFAVDLRAAVHDASRMAGESRL